MDREQLRSIGLFPPPQAWDLAYAERALAAWRGTGLSQSAFARLLGVRSTHFNYWVTKRGRVAAARAPQDPLPSAPVPPRIPVLALREVQLATPPPRSEAHGYELRYEQGFRLTVPPDFDDGTVRRLLALLAERAA